MLRALRLAKRGLNTTDPNPRVGCVIVSNGIVVGEGWHQRAGQAHAEVIALRNAGDAAADATAYVTLEPCSHYGKTPPCADALIAAGISRVVVAAQDPNPLVAGSGLERLRAAGIQVDCGLHAQQSELLNKGFCKRMCTGLPWILSKLAASMDGRTALANGDSKWITSTDARRDVHRLRARSSALMSATGTIRADNPLLTARLDDDSIEVLQPVRVILDSKLSLKPDLQVFQQPGRVILFTLVADARKHQTLIDNTVQVCVVSADGQGRLSLTEVFRKLAEFEINEVMIEAGPTLNGRLLESGLVDEWLVYQAPIVLGDKARGLFNLPVLQSVGQAQRLNLVDVRKIGVDLRLQYCSVSEEIKNHK